MSVLMDLVRPLAGLSVGEIVATLNERNITQRSETGLLQTAWGYGDRYGADTYAAFRDLMARLSADNGLVEDFWLSFRTRGIDLANEQFQAQVDGIIAQVPEQARPLLVALKQMGVWQTSPAEQAGVEANEETVAAALRGLQAESLIAQAQTWEQGQQEQIAHRAAAFIAAVEAWRESGEGDPPSVEVI